MDENNPGGVASRNWKWKSNDPFKLIQSSLEHTDIERENVECDEKIR